MNKAVLIRVDANKKIAMGHLRRCHTIAKELKKYGIKVIMLFSDSESLDLLKKIDSEGIVDSTIVLGVDYKDLLQETGRLQSIVNETGANLILIDSYYINEEYVKCVSNLKSEDSKKILTASLDGLLRLKYSCDIVINTDLGSELSKDIQINAKHKLLGTEYAILREQFSNVNYKIRNKCSNVFISTGGTDPYDTRYKLLKTFLCDSKKKELTYHVVSGAADNSQELLEIAQNGNVKLYSNISNVADIMAECDLAISAGGTTLYELCAVGIPGISFSLADNQLEQVKAFDKRGLITYAGDVRGELEDDTYRAISEYMDRFLNNFEYRKSISEKMKTLVDANGAKKIAKCIDDCIKERFA